MDIDLPRLIVIVAWTLGMAALGTALAGSAVKTWYPTLTKTRIEIPMTLFALVGAVVYVFEAIVAYRLAGMLDGSDRDVALVTLVALAVVMLGNELWNAALFRLRSPFAALIGLLGFLAPLAILLAATAIADLPSFLLMALYAVWVVGYDLPWIRALWLANPDQPHA